MLLSSAAGLAFSWTVAAQNLTGELVVDALDAQGRVLSGAAAHVQSPALIEGTRTRTANGEGQLRFLTLSPGRYVLAVEMPGLATRRQEIVIEVGKTIRTTVKLSPAGFAESIVVEGATRLRPRQASRIASNLLHNVAHPGIDDGRSADSVAVQGAARRFWNTTLEFVGPHGPAVPAGVELPLPRRAPSRAVVYLLASEGTTVPQIYGLMGDKR